MNTYINRYITSVKNIFSNLKDKNVNDKDYTCNFFKQCSDSINLFKNMNDDIYNNLLRVSLNDKLNYREMMTVLKSDYLFHENIFKTHFEDEMNELKINIKEIFSLENVFISGNIIINSLQVREGMIVNGFDINFVIDNEYDLIEKISGIKKIIGERGLLCEFRNDNHYYILYRKYYIRINLVMYPSKSAILYDMNVSDMFRFIYDGNELLCTEGTIISWCNRLQVIDITRMNNDILNSVVYGDDLGFSIYIHGNKDHKESTDTSIIINQLKNKTINNYLNMTEITYYIMYNLYIKDFRFNFQVNKYIPKNKRLNGVKFNVEKEYMKLNCDKTDIYSIVNILSTIQVNIYYFHYDYIVKKEKEYQNNIKYNLESRGQYIQYYKKTIDYINNMNKRIENNIKLISQKSNDLIDIQTNLLSKYYNLNTKNIYIQRSTLDYPSTFLNKLNALLEKDIYVYDLDCLVITTYNIVKHYRKYYTSILMNCHYMLTNNTNRTIYEEYSKRLIETQKWFNFNTLDTLKYNYDIKYLTYIIKYVPWVLRKYRFHRLLNLSGKWRYIEKDNYVLSKSKYYIEDYYNCFNIKEFLNVYYKNKQILEHYLPEVKNMYEINKDIFYIEFTNILSSEITKTEEYKNREARSLYSILNQLKVMFSFFNKTGYNIKLNDLLLNDNMIILNPTKKYEKINLYDCKKNLSEELLNDWKKEISSSSCRIYEQQLELWSKGEFININYIIPNKTNNIIHHFSKEIMTSGTVVFTISRDNFENDVINKFGKELDISNFYKKKKYIRFENEEGIDYGGLKREFLELVSKSIKDNSEEVNGYLLPKSQQNNYWYTIGKILLLCLLHNDKLSVNISPFIFEYILTKNINRSNLMKHYSMLNPKPFSFMEESNEKNGDIIQMITDSLIKDRKNSLNQIYNGFWNYLLPKSNIFKEYIKSLKCIDIYDYIIGKDNINVNDLKSKINSNDNKYRLWLINILQEFTDEEIKMFLQFTTGSILLPNKTIRVYTFKEYNTENLPISSTCEFLLKIPEYKSYEQFKMKLEQAIPCTIFNKY